MFVSAKPVLEDGVLSVNGKEVLTKVPENVVVTPLTNSSAFVGATSETATSRHVFKLGVIRYGISSCSRIHFLLLLQFTADLATVDSICCSSAHSDFRIPCFIFMNFIIMNLRLEKAMFLNTYKNQGFFLCRMGGVCRPLPQGQPCSAGNSDVFFRAAVMSDY